MGDQLPRPGYRHPAPRQGMRQEHHQTENVSPDTPKTCPQKLTGVKEAPLGLGPVSPLGHLVQVLVDI